MRDRTPRKCEGPRTRAVPRAVFRLLLPVLLIPAVGTAGSVGAESPRDMVLEGNSLYSQERYQEALEAYDRASVEDPESPFIYFNKGAAFYRREEFDKAKEAFEQAALKSREVWLEAFCKYNLGNCAFREGMRQSDSDLQKALKALETSVRYYQEALELDPELEDAAHNIEVARLTIKAILDALNKQQEEQEKLQKIAQELERLIKEQEAEKEATAAEAEKLDQAENDPSRAERMEELAERQEQIRQDAEALAAQMEEAATSQVPPQQQSQQQQTQSPLEQAKENVNRAAGHQRTAEEDLYNELPREAVPAQESALEELKKAKETLGGQQGDQQQQNQQQQQQQQQEQQQAQQGSQQEDQEKQEEGEQEVQAAVPKDETAEDILDEEERRERRMPPSGGYVPVDKDW